MKTIASWLSVIGSVFVLAATALSTGDEGRIPPLIRALNTEKGQRQIPKEKGATAMTNPSLPSALL